MLLFEDTDLFVTGATGKRTYDLQDLELMQYNGFIPKEEADNYYHSNLSATPWHEYQMSMYDKVVTAPRMIA